MTETSLYTPKLLHTFVDLESHQLYKFIVFGAMDVTKLYKFIGFGAMDVTKPYKFIGFGGHGCHQTI